MLNIPPSSTVYRERMVSSDTALIAAWLGGDEQAAAELVRRHARALAGFLAAAGAPEAELDDVVQETLIRAFRSLASFRGQCQFRTWLLAIGGNALRDAARRAKSRGGAGVLPLDDALQARGGDPHDNAVADETERRLADGLKQLSPMQREVFLLRARQGMDYSDIAQALGTTPGAARVHYHHAVKRLKELVQ